MTFKYISNENPLILASASPRRKELLEQISIPFIVMPSHIDENGLKGKPHEVCIKLADKKALSLYNDSNDNWILAADTIVLKDGIVMGKPINATEAANMLKSLSNGVHEVITGFSIVDPSGGVAISNHVVTSVKFKSLSSEEIDDYIKTGEPFGKAGAYAIQGIGTFMIKSISGSYSNVVGLPLFAVIDAFKKVKALDKFPFINTI